MNLRAIVLSSVLLFAGICGAANSQGKTTASNGNPNSGLSIEAGFHELYELRFADARVNFASWESAQPTDPLGPAAEAASYLFEEFYAQGVLTSKFFLDDDKLFGPKPLKPDATRKAGFEGAIGRTQALARTRLRSRNDDTNALFAMAISMGMEAEYASIIERRQLDALRKIKDAEVIAAKLLAIDPNQVDANLPIGATQYIIGCLPAYKRFLLWFGGIAGDRAAGMERLRLTAEHGHYLRPYAMLILALAAIRENQKDLALAELKELVAEFPGNPLFAHELAMLGRPASASHSE
jgi:hypothetical protein